MTEKLYYKDPYKREFDAVVGEIRPNYRNGLAAVLLDRTCFYPEGGGQPGDIGRLEFQLRPGGLTLCLLGRNLGPAAGDFNIKHTFPGL